MNSATCTACDSSIDLDDNFCRRCGAAVSRGLPEVRANSAVVRWQPDVPPVVRGAAVVAAGAMGQFMLRRFASSVFRRSRRGTKALQRQQKQDDGLADEAQIITEMVMMRRVRLRRTD
jgi:hypothetical protein